MKRRSRPGFKGSLVAAAIVLASAQPAWAESRPSTAGAVASPPLVSVAADESGLATQERAPLANLKGEVASDAVRELADWIVTSRNNQALPFLIVDKINAKVFVFDRDGSLTGAAAALLGLGRGDDSVPGIGQRKLSTITPAERTTPAGRFEAALGHDFEQDILWIDYDAALSLHRVIHGNPKDRRAQRLASPSVLDNRISYGCINVPAAFYDKVVMPAFKGTVGIVYILPETRPLRSVFAIPAPQPMPTRPSGIKAGSN